ncbi:MAG: SUMF1/EgtB/PvdO family nonheme iron enzyme [Anaerolineae bacterium]
MTEPLSTIIGAKILDQLLSKTFGKAIDNAADSASRTLDTALGRPSKELRDARAKLDKETVQRAAQMESFVEAATKEMQPALAQIKLETGQDHSALFQFPPFLAQVARALLTDLTLDIDALRAEYQAKFASGRSGDLTVPMDLFFEKLTELLARDELWGPALREFRRDAKRGAIHPPQPTELIELAQQIALTLDDLPERTAQAIQRPEQMRLEAWEKSYLRGLYAQCNRLPLEEKRVQDVRPPDAAGPAPRSFRLQRVYVDLDIDQRLTLQRVLDRLDVPPARRPQVKKALMGLAPGGPRQHDWEGDLPDELISSMQEQRRDQLGGREERGEKLKALGIEPAALQQAFEPVTVFEAIRENKQLALLGGPGSGKSTLTRRIAGMLAAEAVPGLDEADADWRSGLDGLFEQWLLPIRIALSKWAKRLPQNAAGVADDLLKECIRVLRETGDMGEERARTYLLDHINASPPTALILLDGLDEVPDKSQREKIVKAIKRFCESHGSVPMIVTCRELPYRDGSYQLPLPKFTLVPLSKASIDAFVQRWHDELRWVLEAAPGDPSKKRDMQERVSAKQHDLQRAIDDPTRPELRKMAGTPLLLTMMARLNYQSGLPGSRAGLYEESIKVLLYEWETIRQDDSGDDTDLEKLMRRAGFENLDPLHTLLNRLAYEQHGATRPTDKATISFEKLFARLRDLYLTKHPEERVKATAWAEQVLMFIDARSGLLLATDPKKLYEFPHRTFQEYLAARDIALNPEHVKRIRSTVDDPNWREVILLSLGHQIFVQNAPNYALLAIYELTHGQSVTTEAMRRRVLLFGEAYLRLLGLDRVRQSDSAVVSDVIKDMPVLLRQAMQRGRLDDPAIDAKTLARQRLDAGLLLADLEPTEPKMDDFVEIPGLGEIGRYPVTHREFKRFMDEGGYRQDKPWWSQNAKSELSSLWRSERPAPRYWDDSRFNRPTQPVVGVSWYEAVAYCAWLSGKLQAAGRAVQARLPTLEEWRQVAGSQTYPWGATFDPARANSEESGLGQTTPVDMYPDGKTPSGVWDMAGNVWEWTNTDDGDKSIIWYDLAGGAYWNDEKNIGSAARYGVNPGPGLDDFGFRVLVVPVSRSG